MPSSRRFELQGPRPQALRVAKKSQEIKKPPIIIYLNPPQVTHARPQDFMSLVQRLTGKSKAADSTEVTGSERDLSLGRREEEEEGVGDSDPLLLSLGQVRAMAPESVPSPVSPGFFSCSPSTNACLQEFGLLF